MIQFGRPRAVAASLGLALLVGCSSPEERFAAHVERAAELTEAGEIDDAILEYRSALKIDSEAPSVNEKLGELLLAQGDLSGTFYLSEALRIEPTRIDIAMRLARVLLVTGQIDEAKAVIDAAKKIDPDDPLIHSTESEYFLYRNDSEESLASAKQAVEADPSNPDLWMQLGRAYKGQMRMNELTKQPVDPKLRQEGIAAFEKADELAGGNVIARVESATLIGTRAQSRKAAIKAFKSAVALAREQEDPAMHLYAAISAEDFAAKADKQKFRVWAIREIVEADPSQLDWWSKLARIADGASGLGEVVYVDMLAKRPDDPGAHLLYTSYLVDAKRPNDAVKHLKKTLDGGLESAALWEQLVRLQLAYGRLANARATFVRMSDEFPDDPIVKRTEARVAIAERRYADAIRILRQEVGATDSFEYHRLLAIAQLRSGDLEAASDSLDRALELSDGFALEAVRLRAAIDDARGNAKGTLRALAAITARRHALTRNEQLMQVRALYALGRAEDARADLERILAKEDAPASAAVLYAQREGARDPAGAREHLVAAVTRSPQNSAAVEALVELELREGRVKEALYIVSTNIKAGNARPETLLLRARILMTAKQYDQAEADALRAFEADPKVPGGVDFLYSVYEVQGRLDEAKASFEEAEAAGVLHSGARLLLARIYLRQGERDRALAMLEKIVREDPDAMAAKAELALAIVETNGNLDRAAKLAQEVQKARRDDPSAADTLGYVYLRKGLHEAALEQFLYAIELTDAADEQATARIHYHKGLTLDALSRDHEAAEAFEKALALDAGFPEADDARARLQRTERPS